METREIEQQCAGLPSEVIDTLLNGLDALLELRRFSAMDFFEPYPKQSRFFEYGKDYPERCLTAGNQYGKTQCGAFEMACHLTGLYPKWWIGRRFTTPIRAWACGETAEKVRDVVQSKLCGEAAHATGPEAPEWGTGFIPKRALISRTLAHGVTNAFDTVTVQHWDASGNPDGISTLGFKSYVQGAPRFASNTLHVVWLDEEPPMAIYTECLARITATNGMVYLTFTALSGPTEVVNRFWNDDTVEARRSRRLVQMGFADALHLANDPAKYQELVGRYPAYEHAARLHGGIMLGEGAVWENVGLDSLIVDPIPFGDIPPYFRKLWGIDFGIGHPFAAILACHDVDTDIIRFIHEIRLKDALPANHTVLMRGVAPTVPVSWPHDGNMRESSNGVELFKFYRGTAAQPGMVMRPTHAQFPDGSYSTEAGIADMLTRMRDGRLEVCRNLPKWQEEFRTYHRKDGRIVKVNDDLMSASRIAVMDIRYARPVHPIGARARVQKRAHSRPPIDPYTGRPYN